MAKFEKMLAKMKNNPQNWKIEDIKVIAERLGLKYRQPGTSHITFRTPNGNRLTVPVHKPIKTVYVKMFIEMVEGLRSQS